MPRIRQRIRHIIPRDNPPPQIFLPAGGNDLEEHEPHLVIREYDRLIKEVKRVAPSSHVVIGRIPYRHFNKTLHENIDKVNMFLENRAKRGDDVSYVDACPAFPFHYVKHDLVHFNRKGNEIFGTRVACELINFQMNKLNNNR